ncbi:uncharacterized protein [Dysidea avara]|uniref:uncharacterized protein isoform X2 n=1 Tax=Dysidea avara TaxID=196820 RepID=UPI003320CCD9
MLGATCYDLTTRTRMSGLIVLLLLITGGAIGDEFGIQPNPIYFDQVPQSQAVMEGDDVSFNCSAPLIETPYNSPVFVWYHNNTEVTNENISHIGNNTSILYITSVTLTDQGDYYCVVKDWGTRTRSLSGKLTVYNDKQFNQVHYLNVTLNGMIILECDFDGNRLSIQWLMNGSPVDYTDKRFHLMHDGSLVVSLVTTDNNYSCEVTMNNNDMTWRSYQALVVSTEQIDPNEISIYPESSTHFVENMTIICNMPAQLKLYNVRWLRNGEFSNSSNGFEILSDNMLTLVQMDASSAEYRCIVIGADNSSLTSPPLMVYKHSIPIIEKSETTHYICANLAGNFKCAGGASQFVTLDCNITAGFPAPTITWYHNGIEIMNNGTSNETLILNKTACDLLGTYQCVAKNEVGTAVLVHRVLPFGRPNAPSTPQFHNEGRVVYLNWAMPTYLAGLNGSFITYQACETTYRQSILESNLMESNLTVIISYDDILLGSNKKYSIKLLISEDAKHGMCQGYDIPSNIKSPFSRILDPVHMIEYGAPTVNLTCPIITQDTQTVVHMDWLPTGSLTLEEMLSDDYKLVSSCKAQWTCSNGTTTSEKQNTCVRDGSDFTIPSSWKFYSCSVNVRYDSPHDEDSPSTIKNCSATATTATAVETIAMNLTTKPSMLVETTPRIELTTTPMIESTTLLFSSTPAILHSTSSFVPTPSSNSAEATIVGSAVAAIAISSFIALVMALFIVVSIVIYICKQKRKHQNFRLRGLIKGSLDSIPKSYSYVAREDQSTCEKPDFKVTNWIKGLEAHDEVSSISSEYITNEYMLSVIYGKDICRHNKLYEVDSSDNTVCYGGSSSSFRNKVMSEKGYVSNTTSTVYNCNDKSPTNEVPKDDKIVNAPKSSDSNCDVDNCIPTESSEFEYVVIIDQDCPVDTSTSQHTVSSDTIQDSYPYVALNIVDNCPADGTSEYHGGEYIKCDVAIKQGEDGGDYQQLASWDSNYIKKNECAAATAASDKPCDDHTEEESTSM